MRALGRTYGERYLEILGALDGGTNSLGQLYELVTTLIGFDRMEAGKTMGLAAWGTPRFLDDLMDAVRFGDCLDDVFAFDPFSVGLQESLVRSISEERQSFTVRADLAASAQELVTRCLLHCYELVRDREFDVLALAGGCALNTVANGTLAARLPAGRRLVVPPHAGDAGIAFGSLWLHAAANGGEPQLTVRGEPFAPAAARPGASYAFPRLHRAAGGRLANIAHDPAVDGPEALAAAIADGAVVGVLNGPSEIGPRALGGRSILADPRSAAVKERINRQIKHREPFRPLAPMVLAEHFDEHFRPPAAADPYMLVVALASERCRQVAPAVVHVDGSARVQVVGPGGDPFLRRVLEAFNAVTGVPMLLNTSFNRRGEPIVETPEQAVDAFVDMGLDGLWLDGIYLSAPS